MKNSKLKERFKEVVGEVVDVNDGDSSVTESPLGDAFRKAQRKVTAQEVKEGLDPDERLDGEDDSDDEIPEKLRDGGKKKEEPNVEEEEKEDKEKVVVLADDKKKKKVEPLDLEEVDKINEDALQDKHGRPASTEAWTVVKQLKATINDFRVRKDAEIKALKEKVVSVTDSEDYKKVVAERDEFKKRFEDRYFEDSPDFVESYVAPYKEKEKEMAEWIDAADIDPQSTEAREIREQIGNMHAALRDGKKVAYFTAVDEIADFLPKGIQTQLRQTAGELYPLYRKKQEAATDKDKTRQEVIKNELSIVDQSSGSVNKTLDSLFQAFESENEPILKLYRSDQFKDVIKYDEIVEAGKAEAKVLVRDLLSTRKPTEKLVRLLSDGIIKKVRDAEVNGLRAALKQVKDQNEDLMKKLDKKGKVISKIATTKTIPGSSQSSEEEDDDAVDPNPLTTAFKKVLAAS